MLRLSVPREVGVDYVSVVEQGAAEFAELLERGDHQAPVPSCPGWTLFDLAEHVGGVHQWAVHAIVHGNPDGQPGSAPRDDLAGWYREQANLLLKTLKETPEDAPAWHFGAKPRTAGWWKRRQAHEVTVHLHDAQIVQKQVRPIAPELAADGVAEVHGVFFPRQVRLGRMPALERSLVVEVAETGERFVFAGADSEAPAKVAGPAEALYLALWKRIPMDDPRLRVERAARELLAAQLTP